MKNIIIITIFLAVVAFAIVGCLYIFEIMTMEVSRSLLFKIEAAILLLGGCSAIVALLTGARK